MPATYQAIISGFTSKEQASLFLDWFANVGEQDWAIEEFTGITIHIDPTGGKIDHPSGVEVKATIFQGGDGVDPDETSYEGRVEAWGRIVPDPPTEEYPYAGEEYGEEGPPEPPTFDYREYPQDPRSF